MLSKFNSIELFFNILTQALQLRKAILHIFAPPFQHLLCAPSRNCFISSFLLPMPAALFQKCWAIVTTSNELPQFCTYIQTVNFFSKKSTRFDSINNNNNTIVTVVEYLPCVFTVQSNLQALSKVYSKVYNLKSIES